MGFRVPEEPKEIKDLIRLVRTRMGGEIGKNNIDYDSFSVWSFNRLPKYLWEQWKDELKERGITWQRFLKILRLHTVDMVEWALYDRLGWTDLIEKIERNIEKYSTPEVSSHG